MPSERELAFMAVKYRRSNGYSIVEAAKKIGIAPNTLTDIEKERQVTKNKFLQVYEFLKENGVEL